MMEEMTAIAQNWSEVSAFMERTRSPWPDALVLADWAWWGRRAALGLIGMLPGRQRLARRWGWREHRVRHFLESRGGSSEGTSGLPRLTPDHQSSRSEDDSRGAVHETNGSRTLTTPHWDSDQGGLTGSKGQSSSSPQSELIHAGQNTSDIHPTADSELPKRDAQGAASSSLPGVIDASARNCVIRQEKDPEDNQESRRTQLAAPDSTARSTSRAPNGPREAASSTPEPGFPSVERLKSGALEAPMPATQINSSRSAEPTSRKYSTSGSNLPDSSQTPPGPQRRSQAETQLGQDADRVNMQESNTFSPSDDSSAPATLIGPSAQLKPSVSNTIPVFSGVGAGSALTSYSNKPLAKPAIAQKFSQVAPEAPVSGTEVDILLSSLSSFNTLSIDLSRDLFEERMQQKSDSPHAPALREFLRLLKRWSGDEAPKDRRWSIQPAQDVDWFLLEIVPCPEAASLDLVAALKDWDDYLERTVRATSAAEKARFPRIWKTALRKQIALKARWEANAARGKSHEGGEPKSGQGSGTAQRNPRASSAGHGKAAAGANPASRSASNASAARAESISSGAGAGGGHTGGVANGSGGANDQPPARPGRETWYWGTWEDGTPMGYPLESKNSNAIPQEWLDEHPGFIEELLARDW